MGLEYFSSPNILSDHPNSTKLLFYRNRTMGSVTSHTKGEIGLEYLSCPTTLFHSQNSTKLWTTYFFHCQKLCVKFYRYRTMGSGTSHTKDANGPEYLTSPNPLSNYPNSIKFLRPFFFICKYSVPNLIEIRPRLLVPLIQKVKCNGPRIFIKT